MYLQLLSGYSWCLGTSKVHYMHLNKILPLRFYCQTLLSELFCSKAFYNVRAWRRAPSLHKGRTVSQDYNGSSVIVLYQRWPRSTIRITVIDQAFQIFGCMSRQCQICIGSVSYCEMSSSGCSREVFCSSQLTAALESRSPQHVLRSYEQWTPTTWPYKPTLKLIASVFGKGHSCTEQKPRLESLKSIQHW